MTLDRFDEILRTGGCKAAILPQPGADEVLVTTHQHDQHPRKRIHRRKPLSTGIDRTGACRGFRVQQPHQQAREQHLEFRTQHPPRRVMGRPRHTNHQIDPDRSTRPHTENFPNLPLQPITTHRSLRHALCHHQAQTGMWQTVFPPMHTKKPSTQFLPRSEDRGKVGRFRQTRGTRKTRAWRTHTARRLRPLARRARITERPPRLRIRTRKPWVRLRRTLEG